ncbi:MAG: CDP-diacylglycerol--glycerol-3-phosphate 3-phosphatidyltransferase [Clostridia bacterium]|nr:CDP-diacylglycerol--glycerol-3-phosphate 3-phosphatidyltransferase [Clostridia bacterium]
MNLPNKITMVRIALIPVVMIFLSPVYSFMPAWYNNFITGPGRYFGVVIFLLAAITDFLDGYLARKHNMVTKLGKFLDPIADKLLVIAVLIILVDKNVLSHWIAMIIIAREIIVMGIRIVAASEGKVIAASVIAKIKTIFQISAITAFLITDIINLGILADVLMGIAVVITLISGFDYVKKNIHIIKQ